jgi:hypothetical protein
MAEAKWVDLSRFGARLEYVSNPTTRTRRLRLLVEDVRLFQDTVTGRPWAAHSSEERVAQARRFQVALDTLGFHQDREESAARVLERGGPEAMPGTGIAVLYSDDLTVTNARLLSLIPALQMHDFRPVSDISPQGAPFEWTSANDFDAAVREGPGIHVQMDGGVVRGCAAKAVPRFYTPTGPRPRFDRFRKNAYAQDILLDPVGWYAFRDPERGLMEVWTSPEDCAKANDVPPSSVQELALPYSVPLALRAGTSSVFVIPDARFDKVDMAAVADAGLRDRALRRQALRDLLMGGADASQRLAAGDLSGQAALNSIRDLLTSVDDLLKTHSGVAAEMWQAREKRFAGRFFEADYRVPGLRALADEDLFTAADEQLKVTGLLALQDLAEQGRLLATSGLESGRAADVAAPAEAPAAAQVRAVAVAAAVREALEAGLFYDAQVAEHVRARTRATDEARDVLLGVFEDVGTHEERQERQKRLLREVAASPRGTWVVLRHPAQEGDHESSEHWRSAMSDGSGRSWTGGGLEYQARMPTYEALYTRMVDREVYRARQTVATEMARDENVRALRNLVAAGLKAGDSFRAAEEYSMVSVCALDPETGSVDFDAKPRQRGKAPVRVNLGAAAFARCVGLRSEALEPWQMTRDEYFHNERAVRRDVGALEDNYVARKMRYEYVNPSPAGPMGGVRLLRDQDAYKVGDEIQATFGAAVVRALESSRGVVMVDRGELLELGSAHHKRMVVDAVAAGKPVPGRVLADYPDIVPAGSGSTVDPEPETARVGRGGRKVRSRQPDEDRIVDVGEKIGGARKDFFANRMTVADLDGMNEIEKRELVSKKNVWGPLDYAAMREDGVEAKTAYAIKWVKDKISGAPTTVADAACYVATVAMVRDELEPVRTADDFEEACARIERRIGEASVTSTGGSGWRNGYSIGFSTHSSLMRVLGRPAWNAISEAQWTLRRGGRRTQDNTSWGALIREGEKRSRSDQEVERYRPSRPHLDSLERVGADARQGRDVSGEELLEAFGFRGIEYGNWLPQDERQLVLNHAYDAFSDLATILDVPPKAMSLGGQLALAFGARGVGRYAAHFEPGRFVVNMTRLRGAGLLAHEWGHAADRWLSMQFKGNGLYLSGSSGEDVRSPEGRLWVPMMRAMGGLRHAPVPIDDAIASVRNALRDMVPAVKRSVMIYATYDNYTGFSEAESALRDSYVASAREMIDDALSCLNEDAIAGLSGAEIAAKLNESKLNDRLVDIYRLHKGPKKSFAGKTAEEIRKWVDSAAEVARDLGRLEAALAAGAVFEPRSTYQVDESGAQTNMRYGSTKYLTAAKALDAKRSKAYYSEPHELFARAFESFVFDALRARGEQSDYLVHGVEADRYAGEFYAGNPYPSGAERESFNAALRSAFLALRESLSFDAEQDRDREWPLAASL